MRAPNTVKRESDSPSVWGAVKRLGHWWTAEREAWKNIKSTESGKPRISRAALAGIFLAVGALFLPPLLTMIVAVAAFGFGFIGLVRSSSPRIRGGFLAIGATALAVLAFGLGLVRAIF